MGSLFLQHTLTHRLTHFQTDSSASKHAAYDFYLDDGGSLYHCSTDAHYQLDELQDLYYSALSNYKEDFCRNPNQSDQ